MASTPAVKAGPAAGTGVLVKQTGLAKPLHCRNIDSRSHHIAHPVLLSAYKLVTGIEIPLRGDRQVLRSRPTALHPLGEAGTVLQVQIKMEKPISDILRNVGAVLLV